MARPQRPNILLSLMACLAALAWGMALVACSPLQALRPDGTLEPVPIDEYLAQGVRVMWVVPHPDDENFAGALLARASIHHVNPMYFLVLTRGEGGECALAGGCGEDLGELRQQELVCAAAKYRAVLQHEAFFNAPLPVSSFPSRDELYRIWSRQGDPARLIAVAMRRFQPDLVLTLDPDHGFTGHPEHQLTARLALQAVRMAQDVSLDLDGLPAHRVGRMYYVLNRVGLMRMVGQADDGPVLEEFDTQLPCGFGKTCLEFMAEATRCHRSQFRDMVRVREYKGLFHPIRLRRVDLEREEKPPDQPVE